MALPIINLSLIPTFPARVFGSGPVVITKAGLDYTFGLDVSTYSLNPAPSGMAYVLSYDPSTESTELIPIGSVAADWDSIVNKPATFPPSAVSASLPAGYVSGFLATNNASDLTNDEDTGAGSARDDTNAFDLVTTQTIVKQLDVAFAEYVSPGTASGGRASADNLTGAKWFYKWMIGGSGKNTQPFYSTSASPTLPTGFTYKKLVGWLYWTGSAIQRYIQRGNESKREYDWYQLSALDYDSSTLGTTPANVTVLVPPGQSFLYFANGTTVNTGSVPSVRIYSPDQADSTPSTSAWPLSSLQNVANNSVSGEIKTFTNTSQQVRVAAGAASTTLRLAATGFAGWV